MVDRLIQYHSDRYVSEINSDVSMLNESERDIIKTAMNKEWTNPKFKMRWFVGETQITPFAKFRQWLLEIKAKEEAIENLEYEIAKWDLEIKRQERRRDTAEDPLDIKAAEIEIWNLTRNQVTTKRRLQDWYLERQQLVDLVTEFLESPESKTPDGKSYLDILNTAEEDKYEEEYWTNRLAKQAACDLLFYGRINSGNMDAICSLPPAQQTETLAIAINYSTQIQKLQTDMQNEAAQRVGLTNTASYLREPEKPTLPKEEDLLNVYNIRDNTGE